MVIYDDGNFVAPITKLVSKKYGTFEVNKTRVVLIDEQKTYIPTKAFPVWGSGLQSVGTVIKLLPRDLLVVWDNGSKRSYPLYILEIYNEKKHGKHTGTKVGPNIGFIIAKASGEIK